MEPRQSLTALLVLVGTAFVHFLIKLYQARIYFVRWKNQGLPMPDHSFVAGHLQTVASMVKLFPEDAIKVYLFGEINRRFSRSGACYLDLWPFAEPFLVITSPYLANQVSSNQALALEKPDALRKWFWSITGGISIFDAPSDQWKPLRRLFSRGFSANHFMTLVPCMVEEAQVYCETLREKAREGKMFYMDPMNLRLMLDIIGQTGLNVRLGCQRGPNPLADALLNQISWKISNQEVNPLQWLNFVRPMVEWYNSRKMDQYINKEVDKRFEAYNKKTRGESDEGQRFESIIDLALQDYLQTQPKAQKKELDKGFRTFATRNMRMLLFSGNDSTGSTISYCYYLLSKNPTALARICAEHDSVFGKDLSKAAPAITNDSHLLNQIPYTNAVIKEALRLFPPAASIRQGADGVDLIDEDGNHYPTGNCMIYILHLALQRLPENFVRPDEFLPERWLVGPEDPLYPNVKGAWRPFEYGPRNCIGQLSVTLGIKTVLALTVREFDIQPAYDEFDKLYPEKGLRTAAGERVYQVDGGSAHPADHFPCRVSLRKEQ